MESDSLFPVVAVIPSLNPDDKLLKTVDGLFRAGFTDVLLVDDGSRQDCQSIFAELEKRKGCAVLHHDVNRGKGRALKTAFSYYLEKYDIHIYQGVVTADADGQHLPEDIYQTAKVICATPTDSNHNLCAHPEHSLGLGTRNFNEKDVPFKSRNGNKITTAVFQMLYGKRINDTQTGLRAISNGFLVRCLEIKGERFEYEINMLIAAVAQKLDIAEIPIQTVYFDDNRETHFHPVKDSIRIYRVMLASFFRFSCSGLFSMLVDQGLFALLQKVVFTGMTGKLSIPLSTLIARICSSYLNYSLNRVFVFESGRSSHVFLVRYYILCAFQMALSAAGVTILYTLTEFDTSLLKLAVDLLLFFISYRVQRAWVFREQQEKIVLLKMLLNVEKKRETVGSVPCSGQGCRLGETKR